MNTSTRPKIINQAAVFAILSLMIGVLHVYIDSSIENKLEALATYSIVLVLLSAPVFFAWKGVNWCRFLFCILVVIGFIPSVYSGFEALSFNISVSVVTLIQSLLQLLSAILFILPDSNKWYKSIKASKYA